MQLDSEDLLSKDLSSRLGLVGYSFQDTESQILFGTVADVLGIKEPKINHTLLNVAVNDLRIKHLFDRTPNELSGGEAQRIALATALRCNPKLIIYDEASSALDPQARRDFKQLVEHLKQRGCIVLLLGQQYEILNAYCDEVLSLQNGRLSQARIQAPILDQNAEGFWRTLAPLSSSVQVPALALENVEFSRQKGSKFTLGPLNLSFRPGEIVGLLGPNGSGKTTLFLLLMGAMKQHSGFFSLDNHKYKSTTSSIWLNTIAMVTQSPLDQIISGSIGEELGALSLQSDRLREHMFRTELIKHFPYLDFARDPLQLSHGQQRMLTILESFLTNHPILLFDEPEQGLDSTSLQYVKSWMQVSHHQKSKTILFSTHDFRFAAEVANRCLLIINGQVIAEISTQDPNELEQWYFTHTKEI
jgi:energy-coupling factor transport system ATP-binding protein